MAKRATTTANADLADATQTNQDDTQPENAAPKAAEKKAEQFPDPNSPNALKKQASERAKSAMKKETFIVKKPQIIDGEWVIPAKSGEKPVEVELLEPQARFRLLNGKLARPEKAKA